MIRHFLCRDTADTSDMSSLEKLYYRAAERDMLDPNSNAGMYTMAKCLDDPTFTSVVDQCKAGAKPDDAVLIGIVVEILFRMLIFFNHADESESYEFAIRQKAKEAAIAVKQLCPEYNWSWISKKYGI